MAFSASGGGNKAFSPFTISTNPATGAPPQQPTGANTFSFGSGAAGTGNPGLNFGGVSHAVAPALAAGHVSQLSFTAPTPAATASSLFSFGATVAPIASVAGTTAPPPSFGFGTPSLASNTTPAGLTGSFGSNNQPNLSFGVPTAAPLLGASQSTTASAPISFTSVPPTAATNTVQPTFGAPPSTQVSSSLGATSTTAPATATGFSFGTTPSSLNLTNPIKPAATTTATTSSAPATTVGGPGDATTTPATQLTTATTTTQSNASSVSQMNFRQLQEAINKWMLDLQEQEKIFLDQATKVNAWDRMLIANGDKIAKLNESISKVKNDHTRLEHALDYLKTQQQEFEAFLEPLEAGLPVNIPVEPEREQLYSLTENVDTQLQQMAEDLKEVIRHINEANKTVDKNDPISQILRILNEHTDALQWVEDNANQVRKSLEDVSKQHQMAKKEHERSLRQMFK